MTQASSIGKLNEPYYNKDNNRIKAFYSEIITEQEDLEKKIISLKKMQAQHQAGRITSRFIVSDVLNFDFEARIPLNKELTGYSLVYFGENFGSRIPDNCIVEQELAYVDSISNRPIKSLDDQLLNAQRNGYTLEILESPIAQDIQDIIEVYKNSFDSYTYELNSENVSSLVSSNDNLVCVARDKNNKIVSIGVAETAAVSLIKDGVQKDFKFSELSDAATLPKHRSKGLYSATTVMLHRELAKRDFDLVYGEARACNYGVNLACQKIGRQFYGLLQKHCIISGVKDIAEEGPYENLNVWALNYEQLKKFR